ncbi:serine/threonine-protein kinase, partial [Patulibacter sp. NPDC049589]|uniref:serine/threonine-protein kinase n=1 Tax=Patulibacter sp. NPDC049589 TaxID=3154731 RepID=UPI003426E054
MPVAADSRVTSHGHIHLEPGTDVDGFEIVETIVVGGASATYRALHRALDRHVALKLLQPATFADEHGSLAAAREAAGRVARLEHPSIAPVYASGVLHGGLWIAGALLEGRTLAAPAKLPGLTPDDVARIVGQAGAALGHAHAQGIQHRDLRPDCVVLDAWGHVRLHDFGVARTSGRTGLLSRSEILETLRFTAPELVLGRPATPATDVYALAAVAVWCLTGEPPHPDLPLAEYVVERTSAAPPALHAPDGAVAGPLSAAVADAMRSDPGDRCSLSALTAA